MARGGYRQQGSDQAVRVVFRPSLGLKEVKIVTLGSLALFAALLLTGTYALKLDGHLSLVGSVLMTSLLAAALSGPLKRAHDVVIGSGEVKLRIRHFPGLWSERRVARTTVQRLARAPAWGSERLARVRLALELSGGAQVPLFGGLDLDLDTAEKLEQAIARALDPEQIEELADEHRGVPSPDAGRASYRG